jgi:antitoxin YqcF
MSDALVHHMERVMGPIAHGWAANAPSVVRVCCFERCPREGLVTYSTLGLSDHVLHLPRNREVRQELLLSVDVHQADANLAMLLAHVAEQVENDHKALLRGAIVSLSHPVSPMSGCTALYVSLPVVFPETIATYGGSNPPTVFAWMIPIHPSEAALIREGGWSEFEDRFERGDPDTFDLRRPPIL